MTEKAAKKAAPRGAEAPESAAVAPATGTEIERSGHPLAYVPRLLIGLLDDVRTIATSVTVLPEVARSLSVIEARVSSMDDEVRKMRQGVDALGGDVGGLRETMEPLESELREMHTALHPLRRFSSRMRRGSGS
jgi:hypothetical protein